MLGSAHREPTEMLAHAICTFPHSRPDIAYEETGASSALYRQWLTDADFLEKFQSFRHSKNTANGQFRVTASSRFSVQEKYRQAYRHFYPPPQRYDSAYL